MSYVIPTRVWDRTWSHKCVVCSGDISLTVTDGGYTLPEGIWLSRINGDSQYGYETGHLACIQ